MLNMAVIETVANIISTENLHCTKLSAQLNISREVLNRILSGKQKAGQGVLSKLSQFVQDYENGQFDIKAITKPRKAVKPVHVLAENEVWIAGYEGKYSVDTDGNVFSVFSNRLLEGAENEGGYKHVDLGGNQQYRQRIVAKAFLPNPLNLEQVNHKNGDKDDNSVANLEWITAEDNIRHALLNGYYQGRGIIQLDQDGTVIAKFNRISEASRATGLHATSIVRCAKGKQITTGGFRWEYSTIYAGKASKKKTGNISGQVLTGSLIVW